jgi:hypothetical protein
MQQSLHNGAMRLIAGYAAIAFSLPYLALKIAWISGAPVGMLDKSLITSPSLLALNITSFVMDVVAALLALTFTRAWGLRAPAGPTLFPMWVGTGFLAPIAVAWPIVILAQTLGLGSDRRPSSAPSMLEPWVTTMVYTLFTCQGLALMTAFILYGRARWGARLRARISDGQPSRPAVALLGDGASMVAATAGLLHLLWAGGAPLGLPTDLLQSRGASFYMLQAAFGLAALGAAAGTVLLVNRLGRRPLWFPLSLAWVGSGAMFSWGAWFLLGASLRFTRVPDSWLLTANNVAKTGAGLLIGALIGMSVVAPSKAGQATLGD